MLIFDNKFKTAHNVDDIAKIFVLDPMDWAGDLGSDECYTLCFIGKTVSENLGFYNTEEEAYREFDKIIKAYEEGKRTIEIHDDVTEKWVRKDNTYKEENK